MYQVNFIEAIKENGEEKQISKSITVPGIEPALALANVLVRISTCDPSGQLIYRGIEVLKLLNGKENEKE